MDKSYFWHLSPVEPYKLGTPEPHHSQVNPWRYWEKGGEQAHIDQASIPAKSKADDLAFSRNMRNIMKNHINMHSVCCWFDMERSVTSSKGRGRAWPCRRRRRGAWGGRSPRKPSCPATKLGQKTILMISSSEILNFFKALFQMLMCREFSEDCKGLIEVWWLKSKWVESLQIGIGFQSIEVNMDSRETSGLVIT